MGTFAVQVEVAGPERERYEAVDLLVDTGSTYTVLPRQLLEQLGVAPLDRSEFRLADGSTAELDVGRVWVRYDGRERHTLVVFGDSALLGAVTLEELLLAPDPVQQRLVPVLGLMMRLAA